MKSIINTSSSLLGMTAILLATGHAGAQGIPTSTNLRLDAVETPDGPNFSIVFTDDGTGATDYVLEYTPSVGAEAEWTVDGTASVSPIGGDQYRATTQRPPAFGAYRLVAYDTAGELTGQFASPTIELSEDAGGLSLLVLFSRPFTGTLNYVVGGTGGTQFAPLSGSITVNNATTARIALGLSDDTEINELRFLTLDIDNSGGLLGGANSQALITVVDNDAVWNGTILLGDLELPFDYRQTRSEGVYQAVLVSDGTGPLPAGEFPASVGAVPFPATIAGIQLDADSSALKETPTMTIQLTVQEGVGNQRITDTEIEGTADIITAYPGKPHLDVTKSGPFLLLKPSPPPSTAEVELANNTD